jgi:hypothetical protein
MTLDLGPPNKIGRTVLGNSFGEQLSFNLSAIKKLHLSDLNVSLCDLSIKSEIRISFLGPESLQGTSVRHSAGSGIDRQVNDLSILLKEQICG